MDMVERATDFVAGFYAGREATEELDYPHNYFVAHVFDLDNPPSWEEIEKADKAMMAAYRDFFSRQEMEDGK